MKKIVILFFFGLFFAAPSVVFAEGETISINLKVQAADQVLFEGNFDVEKCEKIPDSGEETFNAWCAVQQLADQNGWDISKNWSEFGVFLDSMAGFAGDLENNRWWLWYSDWESGMTSLNEHELASGENLLLVYGTSPLKIAASSLAPPINSTTTISSFYFDSNSWQWIATSTTLLINEQEFEAVEGIYEFFTSTTTPYGISARKDGFVSSREIAIASQLPTRKANLRIETATSSIMNQEIEFSACESVFGLGIYDFNAFCAISQFAPRAQWSWWGEDAFLDSVDGYQNNADGNGVYWLWFDGLEYGQASLNKSILQEGDDLLLVYGTNPLMIFMATTTPQVGEILEIRIDEFGFDAAWNASWLASASSTLSINGDDIFLENGIYQLTISTTSPYLLAASKDGFIGAPAAIISAKEAALEEPAPKQSGGGGGGATVLPVFDFGKAVQFLIQNQSADGSFGPDLYTDWAAVALGAVGGYQNEKTRLKNFLLSDELQASVFMDYQRRAMALMSLGIDPYRGTSFNYIKKIIDSFDGKQFGNASYFNDDIFGILILLNAGYGSGDEKIISSLDHILSYQDDAGSFGGIDLTAAAVQMLSLFSGNEKTETAKTKAVAWLAAQQGSDGGFGNSYATSWVIQAIVAADGDVSSWLKNGRYPLNYLGAGQIGDGGLENGLDINNRIWATAYAVAAALGKTWDEIMANFSASAISQNISGQGGQSPEPEQATSTLENLDIPEETEISTSTPENEEIEVIIPAPENILAVDNLINPEPKQENPVLLIQNKNASVADIDEENSSLA
ncbi:MAG: terpene cyclase/mutase family protein, partial [Candidatus Portnoybacteria bacterium]|nr:terpene cyclase/mutase family protein [Candidatus Portnoybacteria bacterium]